MWKSQSETLKPVSYIYQMDAAYNMALILLVTGLLLSCS